MLDPNSQPSNKPIDDWGYAGFGRKSLNHDDHRHRFGGGGVAGDQFRLETMEEDSGVCSPPLWRSISPPASPRNHHNNPRYLSPTSRAQAIARGQQELMEMVSNMPETSYELSLKDIVDQRRDVGDVGVDETETQSVEEGEERSILGGSQKWNKKKKGSVKKQESSKKVKIRMKNGSFDHNKGLFINMVFPFSFGTRKNSSTRSSSSVNGDHSLGAKVSPRPELFQKPSNHGGAGGGGAGGAGGGDHREWLWKRFTVTSDNESLGITESSSGGTTDRSGSSGSSAGGSVRSNSARKTRGCIRACWPFFPSRKKKS